jgi:hypothetical protein
MLIPSSCVWPFWQAAQFSAFSDASDVYPLRWQDLLTAQLT